MIIGLFNNKGGVGKSTIVLNLAYEYMQKGKKVCVVDIDGQANTTEFLKNPLTTAFDNAKALKDIINEGENFFPTNDAIPTRYNNIWLIPATSDNNNLTDDFCNGVWGDFDSFCEKLNAVKEILNKCFDVVLIDYPPTFNDVVKVFLSILNDVTIVPVVIRDGRSIQALFNIVDFVGENEINTQILVNRFEGKASENKILAEWKENDLPICETIIPLSGYITQADNSGRFLSDKFRKVKNDKVRIFEKLANEIG